MRELLAKEAKGVARDLRQSSAEAAQVVYRPCNGEGAELASQKDWQYVSFGVAQWCAKRLDSIEAARTRLAGVKGDSPCACDGCGKEIEDDRLGIIPWTAICSECALQGKRS